MTPIKAGADQAAAVAIGDTIAAYLAGLDRPETRTTHTQYRATLRRLAAHFGPGADVAGIGLGVTVMGSDSPAVTVPDAELSE